MGRAYSTNGEKRKFIEYCWESLKEWDHEETKKYVGSKIK
jgi:hypothetical protein